MKTMLTAGKISGAVASHSASNEKGLISFGPSRRSISWSVGKKSEASARYSEGKCGPESSSGVSRNRPPDDKPTDYTVTDPYYHHAILIQRTKQRRQAEIDAGIKASPGCYHQARSDKRETVLVKEKKWWQLWR